MRMSEVRETISLGSGPRTSRESKKTEGRRFSRPFFDGVSTWLVPSMARFLGGIQSFQFLPSLTISIA